MDHQPEIEPGDLVILTIKGYDDRQLGLIVGRNSDTYVYPANTLYETELKERVEKVQIKWLTLDPTMHQQYWDIKALQNKYGRYHFEIVR